MPTSDAQSSFPVRRLALLIACTVLCYFSLYAPQPLLPVFERAFAVGLPAAAALITVSFVFLAIAPLVYGVVLEAWPTRRVLRVALPVLGLGCLLFGLAPGYGWLMGARVLQALALPAAITAIVTTISESSPPGRMQMTMSIYIAATIAGGYLGRLGAGAVAEFWNWRVFFVIVGVLLAGATFLAGRAAPASARPAQHPRLRLIGRVLADADVRAVYGTIFCVFFTFATILSFLPFRLADLSGESSPLQAGVMYSGYMVGLLTALAAQPLARGLGGARRATLIACGCYLLSIAALAVPQTPVIFAAMFPFCAAMFLIHSLAIGHLNERATELRGLTNGLYVGSYYLGGILGSFLPSLIYHGLGWGALLAVAGLSVVGAGVFTVRIDWPR